MTSLRDKTISGIFWSFLQTVGSGGIQFIATLILARILTPGDFGLIGMLTIFITVSQTLVSAGFNQALIQKKETDEEDYSSVFYINLVISICLYGILFFTAPLIADFYHQPILISLTRVLALIFIINAFSYVQQVRLIKEMRFKTLMLIHLPSTIISGFIAIMMAFYGYGVWSIVALQLIMQLAYAIQIWAYSKWKPLFSFNKKKSKSLFNFGSKLMISGIIHSIYENVYLVIIGKFFPLDVLGYYQNAQKLVDTPTQAFSSVISSVTFPAFSSLQDNDTKLKEGYKRSIQQLLFWLCPLLTLSAVLAKPLFRIVLTDKWLPSVPFFQLLCIVGIFYPLNAFNLNIVNVKGRSDLFLKLEIIKKIIITIGIIITLPLGIWPLIIFQVVFSFIAYFLNSYFSGRFIHYSVREQIKDIFPIFFLSISVGLIVLLLDKSFSNLPEIMQLIIGFGIGSGLYWFTAKFFHFEPYFEFKHILQTKFINHFAK